MRQRRGAPVAASRIAALRAAFHSWSTRTKAVLLASVVLVGVCVPAAMASTLAAEHFMADERVSSQRVTVACGPNGDSPFTYHVEGAAAGPHSGTFVEDGQVVMGPLLASGVAPLISLDATFTIMSSMGDVSGEKHVLGTAPAGFAACGSISSDLAVVHSSQLCYRATFSDGSTEEGRSSVGLALAPELGDRVFSEDFFPDPTVSCRGNAKVTICHHPPGNPDNAHTIEVGFSAVPHHLGHGDTPGPCLP